MTYPVGGIFHRPASVAGHNLLHSVELLKDGFDAPGQMEVHETECGE